MSTDDLPGVWVRFLDGVPVDVKAHEPFGPSGFPQHHYLPAGWEDVKDQWSDAIKAAHPTRSGSHEQYGVAMQMVGHRHSKGELVSLVNWLLVRLAEKEGR